MAGEYEGEDFEWVEPEDFIAVEDTKGRINEHETKVPVWMKVGTVAAAGLSGIVIGGEIAQRLSSRTPEAAQPAGCPTIPSPKIKHVQAITDRATSPFDILVEKFLPSSQKSPPEEAFRSLREREAKKYDLTLVDERPYQKELWRSKNVSTALDALNKFTGRYGFMVWAYGKINLDYARFINGSTTLMNTFRYLPVEEVKAIGLQEIKIVERFTSGPGSVVDAAAQASTGNGVIEISEKTFYDPSYDIYYHELGHLADAKFCGEFGFNYYDPQYTDLNPGSLEYGVAAPRGSVVSEYAQRNMSEDKAETYVGVIGPLNPEYFHGRSKIIRQKADLLLARLNELAPGIAEYLSAISTHKYE